MHPPKFSIPIQADMAMNVMDSQNHHFCASGSLYLCRVLPATSVVWKTACMLQTEWYRYGTSASTKRMHHNNASAGGPWWKAQKSERDGALVNVFRPLILMSANYAKNIGLHIISKEKRVRPTENGNRPNDIDKHSKPWKYNNLNIFPKRSVAMNDESTLSTVNEIFTQIKTAHKQTYIQACNWTYSGGAFGTTDSEYSTSTTCCDWNAFFLFSNQTHRRETTS